MKLAEIMNILCCAMCSVQFVIGYLHPIMATNTSSMLSDTADHLYNEISGSGSGVNYDVDCVSECSDTNLMVTDKHFLVEWLRIDSQYSISKLSLAANDLRHDTQYLQTIDCGNYTTGLGYRSSQNITYSLLRQFYDGYVLHRGYIKEKLLVLTNVRISHKKQLKLIKQELEHNIARIYFLINASGCHCLPDNCDEADRALETLKQSTEYCFLNGNIPINDIAHQIRNDAHHLHYIIKHLESTTQEGENADAMQPSFNFKEIKKVIAMDNNWCNY